MSARLGLARRKRTPITAPASVTGNVSQVSYAFAQTIATPVTGGVPPYTYAMSTGVPPGITRTAGTLSFSGTPTTAGSYSGLVTVTDSVGQQATFTLFFDVAAAPGSLMTSTTFNGTTGSRGIALDQGGFLRRWNNGTYVFIGEYYGPNVGYGPFPVGNDLQAFVFVVSGTGGSGQFNQWVDLTLESPGHTWTLNTAGSLNVELRRKSTSQSLGSALYTFNN